VALVLLLGSVTAQGRTLEHRAEKAMATRRDYVLALVLFWPFVLVIAGALVLVVLGPFPDREPALYLTAVVFGLFVAATMLFSLVFSQGRPPQTDRSEPVAESLPRPRASRGVAATTRHRPCCKEARGAGRRPRENPEQREAGSAEPLANPARV
jgi:hypothetical protein